MDQFNIDKDIKAALYNHSIALDKNDLWEAIETRQKKSRYRYIILVIGALLITGSSLWIVLNNNTSTSTSSVDFFTATQSPDNITASTANEGEVDPTIQKPIAQGVTTPINKQKNTASEISANSGAAIATTSNRKKMASNNNSDEYKANRTTFATTDSGSNVSLNRSIQKAKNHTNTISNSTSQSIIPSTSESQLQSSTSATKTKESISSLNLVDVSAPESIYISKATPGLKSNKVECYEYGEKVDPLYLELYSSVDYVQNWFDAPAEFSGYMDSRDASQTQLEGYRAGLQLKYLTKWGIYAKAGLEVGWIKERFDTELTETTTEIRPNQLLETIERADTTILVFGDAPVTVTETTTFRVFNTYRTIGIPFLLGFQKEYNNLTYGIELGGIYDINYNFKGTLLNPSLEPEEVTDYFRSSNISSITGGINVGYNLTTKYKLFARCSIKHNLDMINQGNNLLDQSNTRIGLGLGLEMKL